MIETPQRIDSHRKKIIMKVCHFTSVHEADDIRIYHKECTSLSEEGFEVYLVAPIAYSYLNNDVKVIIVELDNSCRINRFLRSTRKIYQKALEIDADIYHFHDPELIPYGLKLLKKGKKVIYDVHEDVPRQILGKYWINPFLRKIISYMFEKYENKESKKFSCIITATPHIKKRFVKLSKNTIDIMNYPRLEKLQETKWEKKNNEICYIGVISEIRGIRELLISLDNCNAKLNLAGNYSPKNFKVEISKFKQWKKVNEFGIVNREEVKAILYRSKIGIVTLYPLVNYFDALPVKMFEYMAAGIPVIASDFPLWKEIIEKNKCGICVNPQEPSEISDAINYLLNNDNLAEKMGKNGRIAVEKRFNWQIEKKKLLGAYHELKN